MKLNKIAKVIFLGDTQVGKSALFSRITQNTFNDYNISTMGTICVPKYHKNETKSLQIRINFWDTAGQERFRSITKNEIYGANIILFCSENESTFQSIKDFWYKECEKLLELSNCLKILLKTKSDIKLENDENLINEMKEYSKTIGAMFFETSAKEDKNIDSLFNYICYESEKLKLEDDKAQNYLNRKESEGRGCSC